MSVYISVSVYPVYKRSLCSKCSNSISRYLQQRAPTHTVRRYSISLTLTQKNIAELQTLFRSSCRETLFASEKLRQCAHVSSRCMFEREFIYYIAYLGVSSGHSTSVSKYITHAFVQFFSRKSIKYIVTSKTGDNKLIVYSYLRI